jgi:hypothetical protein
MTNAWFRLYSEFMNDPKVQMMTEAMQRRLVMLFCMRCNKGETFHETFHETEIAFVLRISETELAETKAIFLQKGFIDSGWNLKNWNKRQYISDNSTGRVKKHRGLKALENGSQQPKLLTHVVGKDERNDMERFSNVSVTPPDTDTDTDTDTEGAIQTFINNPQPLLAAEIEKKPEKTEKTKRENGKRLPVHWKPSEADALLAKEIGFDDALLARETANFRDYWLSKSGKDATKLDWDATFRNWIRKTRIPRPQKPQQPAPNDLSGVRAMLGI